MRVKLFNRAGALGLFLAVLVSCFPVDASEAANINFSQSILPVKFVYMDKAGQIQRIWSNVGDSDSLYRLKFFQAKNNIEIGLSSSGLENFKQKEENVLIGKRTVLAVEFINKGDSMEEVRTIV